MCLVDTKRFRITTKPIKVYKVVIEFEHSKRIGSPYRSTPLHKGLNFAGLGTPEDRSYTVNGKEIKSFAFEGGFIHAYERIQDAMNSAMIHNIHAPRYRGYDYKVVECTIPPFTRYAIEYNHHINLTTLCSRFLWIGKTVY